MTAGTVTNATINSSGITSTTAQSTSIATNAAVSTGTDLSAASVQALADGVTGTKSGALSTAEETLLTNMVREVNTSNANPGSTASTLEIDNNSGLDLRYVTIKEFGIGYGFSFMEDKLHVAPVLKILSGEATSSSINLADSTSENKDIGDELTKDTNSKSSTDFTLDVGLLYEVNERFQVGLSLRDLTSPSFETVSGTDIELEPTARAGVAYQYTDNPGWRGVVAADLDIIKSESAVLKDSDSQQIAVGVSQEMMGWLSLRAGLMKNFAGESDGMVYSAGLGFQIFKAHIDISGVFSSDDVTVDGDDYPTKGGAGASLGLNMNF